MGLSCRINPLNDPFQIWCFTLFHEKKHSTIGVSAYICICMYVCMYVCMYILKASHIDVSPRTITARSPVNRWALCLGDRLYRLTTFMAPEYVWIPGYVWNKKYLKLLWLITMIPILPWRLRGVFCCASSADSEVSPTKILGGLQKHRGAQAIGLTETHCFLVSRWFN